MSWGEEITRAKKRMFVFKQKTEYEVSECDWSADVCSSDLVEDDQSKSLQIYASRYAREYTHGKELRLLPRIMEEFLQIKS